MRKSCALVVLEEDIVKFIKSQRHVQRMKRNENAEIILDPKIYATEMKASSQMVGPSCRRAEDDLRL